MKKILILLLCLPVFLFGQDKAPSMFEVTTMTVKRGMEDKFEAAVKQHNEKYHKEGMYHATLAYNMTGPSGGTYSWIMGPLNWAALDNRPGKGAHDDDWKSVDQYVEKYSAPSLWDVSSKLSHWKEDKPLNKRMIWAYDLKSGKSARWSELVEKVKKVYEEKLPDESFRVAWNEMSPGNGGTNVVIIWGFENWATLDRDRNFGALYEEVHGKGSWHTFLNEFNDTVEERTDWMREMIK